MSLDYFELNSSLIWNNLEFNPIIFHFSMNHSSKMMRGVFRVNAGMWFMVTSNAGLNP